MVVVSALRITRPYTTGMIHLSCPTAMFPKKLIAQAELELRSHIQQCEVNIPRFRDATSGHVHLGTVRLSLRLSSSAYHIQRLHTRMVLTLPTFLDSAASPPTWLWPPSTSVWAYTRSCAHKCLFSAHLKREGATAPRRRRQQLALEFHRKRLSTNSLASYGEERHPYHSGMSLSTTYVSPRASVSGRKQ